MLEYWYAFPVAIFVSTFAMVTGGEGAILFVPFFIAIGMEPHFAIGTAFITQLFGKTSGTIGYLREGGKQHGHHPVPCIQRNVTLLLVLAGIPFIIAGSYLTSMLTSWLLQFAFGIATMGMAAIMLYSLGEKHERMRSRRESLSNSELYPWLWVPALAGFLTGVFAIGAGTINLVFLERKMGLQMHKAVATVVATMAFTAMAGALVHISSGDVFWDVAVFAIGGVLIGGQLGPWLAHHMKAESIKLLFAVLTFIVGIVMCAKAISLF